MTGTDAVGLQGPSAALQLAEVARRFYLRGQSKQDIAAELGLTRFKVARLIDQAHQAGVVRIEVTTPEPIDPQLSEELAAAYHLRHAIVLAVPDHPESDLRQQLAKVAAALLSEIVTDQDVLGIGYGRTLNATTAALTHLARCTTVQLTGALLGVQVSENSIELVRRVAAITGGPAYPLYTPQVLPDPSTAHALRQQPQVAQAYQRFDHITTAVVAVGSWEPPHSQLYEALNDTERDRFRDLGVTAEVCATLLNAQGSEVAADFADRCIAITSTQLQAIPHVIAVAGGTTKRNAIQAALQGGYANSLITNHTVARHLLEHPTHPVAVPAGFAGRRPSVSTHPGQRVDPA